MIREKEYGIKSWFCKIKPEKAFFKKKK